MANDPKTNPGGDGERLDVRAASQGQKTGHIRWVLAIGTTLAVIALVITWLSMHH
jgi:hypothetical protein